MKRLVPVILVLSFFLLISYVYVCYAYRHNIQREHTGIIVATWNIGHFSTGTRPYSTIPPSELDNRLSKYKSFIYDSINADIFCINEYDNVFCEYSPDSVVNTEKTLFKGFRIRKVFHKNSYVCNAVFSNWNLNNPKMHYFKYTQNEKFLIPKITWYYYTMADINIAGQKVKLVCTHLINKSPNLCQEQIKYLISVLKKYKRVVICGDFNTTDFSQFKDAGYTLANDQSIVTFSKVPRALDNIIVKGLKITGTRVIRNTLSDHYPLVCCLSIL